ncbi:hypothetical protein CI610_03215 [invertebrate metagenome]|uniref:Uncharacterized protein n=1 Tax=invertebrate metagenome TaxID=1711999 RepID=A0A2H9T3S0_9ZZZZ
MADHGDNSEQYDIRICELKISRLDGRLIHCKIELEMFNYTNYYSKVKRYPLFVAFSRFTVLLHYEQWEGIVALTTTICQKLSVRRPELRYRSYIFI